MKYSTNNVLVSLTNNLATMLRANGYDVLWHKTGTTDARTDGSPEAKATVTLVSEFPANPTFIVRLKSDTAGAEEIVVPALSLRLTKLPMQVESLGIGHTERYWEREVMVDGLAADEFQHRDLLDLLHDWLRSVEFKKFGINDYDTNKSAPPALEPVEIQSAGVFGQELVHENEAVRYYMQATARFQYVE